MDEPSIPTDNEITETQNDSPNTGDLFQSLGIRCPFCDRYQMDGITFNHRHLILLGLCILVWHLFLSFKN